MRARLAGAAALIVLAAGPAAAQQPRHPACTDPVLAPPGDLSGAEFLAAPPRAQLEAVAALRAAMAAGGLDGLPPDCAAFYRDCLDRTPDDLGTAVAQGYLTGREELAADRASQGILTAIGLYCLGAWSPGPG